MPKMVKLRELTPDGLRLFSQFLDSYEPGDIVPADLLENAGNTRWFAEAEIDAAKEFGTRYELGTYLVDVLSSIPFPRLMARESDGFWAWVAALYFSQLSSGDRKKPEHFIVTRTGFKGSLAYRQGPRIAYELTHVHGTVAQVCLNRPVGTFGDLTEQLSSRQDVARDRAMFRAAYALYFKKGKIVRGAAGRCKKLDKRKPGDRTGYGGAGRLGKYLRRLVLTYDTAIMTEEALLGVFPKEFRDFASSS
jgi:hypothetical protein